VVHEKLARRAEERGQLCRSARADEIVVWNFSPRKLSSLGGERGLCLGQSFLGFEELQACGDPLLVADNDDGRAGVGGGGGGERAHIF